MKSVIQYFIRIFIFVVISLVVGLTFYTINARRVTGNKLVMPFNKTIAVVLTGSMEPTIGVNDLIVIEKTNDYKIDDIVVYQSGDILIVHRIASIDGDIITTSGDANDGALDNPIDVKFICGEVIDIIPNLGFILKFFKSPIGIIIVMCLSLFLLALSYKKENKENEESLDSIKLEIEKLKKEIKE